MTTKFLPTTLLLLEGERGECPHLFTIDDKEGVSLYSPRCYPSLFYLSSPCQLIPSSSQE